MVTPALVWPGFDPASHAQAKMVRRRLARAARREVTPRDPLGLAAAALDIEPPPAAALARLADGLETGEQSWFRAEPVTLAPDRDTLALLPLTAAPLERREEEALVEAARTHFGDALTLERGPSGRWYAALETVSAATGASLDEVVGRPLDVASLASGPDATRLRAFLTELQMLWYEHPVNRSRRAAGRPEANALWLWGGGRLPAEPKISEPLRLCADAPEMIGLACWLGLECEALGEPKAGDPQGGSLVVIGSERAALGEAWLGKFIGLRGGFRVYAANSEWRVPARRGLLHLRG